MKIKFQQLDSETRDCISFAVQLYAASLHLHLTKERQKYFDISQKIHHGELLICEYQYNELEKGGQDGTGHHIAD